MWLLLVRSAVKSVQGNARWRVLSSMPTIRNRRFRPGFSSTPSTICRWGSSSSKRREVVFCNQRYAEIYRLSSEQVRPGTAISQLVEYRRNLSKVRSNPGDDIRERIANAAIAGTTVIELTDGRIISRTVYPMPDGGGMATHEDITDREELSARLKRQFELGKGHEEKLRIANLQFDIAINNMSQGLCFFDAEHRLIVCNDRFLELYGLQPDRVGPGTSLTEIVDMRFEAGSFPAMSRDEYIDWRTKVAVSAEPSDTIVELRNGRPSRSGTGRDPTAVGSEPVRTLPSESNPKRKSRTWRTTTR